MKIRVTLEGQESFVVETRPIDNVRFEDTAQKHKWGTAQESPLRFVYFLAYSACSREGLFDRARGFNAFMDELVDVDPESERTDDDENPTEPGPMPG